YEELRHCHDVGDERIFLLLFDLSAQRSHHQTGPSRPVFFSPSLTTSPASGMGGAVVPGTKKTSPLPSTRLSHQRNEVLSPMYQLPKFVNSPPRNLEMSPKQKARLDELRLEKANCEQFRRKNNQLGMLCPA
ncbi:unnamed protein product, partial [Hydatigera taeniaeformis]|uniref:ALMS_motif domain-containing protein n=1 Tax=Hydatigena taeniaeformis TaxID=6205 RepID=A0A0R3WPK1_HYDTA